MDVEDRVREAVARISEAPLNPEIWPVALESVARLNGGWGGQLLAAHHGQPILNIGGGVSSDILQAFEDRGGTDPRINPRVGFAMTMRPMEIFTDTDFISDETRRRHPFYQEFLDQVGAPYCSMAALHAHPGDQIFAVVLRSAAQGPPDAIQKRVMTRLLPELAQAVRFQARLESRAAIMTMRAFEGLAVPALLCERSGKLIAATSQGDDLLSEQKIVASRGGYLRAVDATSHAKLSSALSRAGAGMERAERRSSSVLLFSAARDAWLSAEVASLAGSQDGLGGFAPILVLFQRKPSPPLDLLSGMGLTRAEAEIASMMGDGRRPGDIAQARGVALSTVRYQVRTIYAKLGVNRQVELLALLRSLG
ncbi:helix-turn-helix transcriptional regulator [Caulobacter sp. Root1455]|uniref:helix-turn-helix transcriptional regulator n=1 Tax=Caulobacter sp. Root1455 TaxID=1736465 RepID=UPI00138EDCA8|nr:helix-turn-helix transcriptional regulator [Caulobacter sp. Root1455]